jgi:hypothetical protein
MVHKPVLDSLIWPFLRGLLHKVHDKADSVRWQDRHHMAVFVQAVHHTLGVKNTLNLLEPGHGSLLPEAR